MGYAQNKKQFLFTEITKPDHKLSKTSFFYFIFILCRFKEGGVFLREGWYPDAHYGEQVLF